MKKINVKVTAFLCVTVLAVVVLLLNLVEFRRVVDFTVPGIRMPKENAFGKQEEVQVSVSGTYYYRVLPWIHGSSFHGQISFVGAGEEPQNYFFTYGGSRGFGKDGTGAVDRGRGALSGGWKGFLRLAGAVDGSGAEVSSI